MTGLERHAQAQGYHTFTTSHAIFYHVLNFGITSSAEVDAGQKLF